MNTENMKILTNIIGGVESGGQQYGKRRYEAYAGAYQNSQKEVTCTLGWAQNYGNEGRKLCKMILERDPAAFRKADTAGIEKKLAVDWVGTHWNPTAAQKKALIAIITTAAGKQCQDELFHELIQKYLKKAEEFGVTGVKAQMMWCEIEHLGGLGPTQRIFKRAAKPYTPESIYASLIKDQKDSSSNNQVGDKKYQSRHECCVRWINQYVEEASMTAADKRNTVVNFVKSREGKNQYTQSSKRTQVSSGYSDCSSLVWAAYCKINMAIGDYTGAQIGRGTWVTKGGSYPDESKLLPGDLLFFASGSNNGRPYNVGHVEMYVGNGQISGHGSGTGPTRKNMVTYCKQRNSAGRPYIGAKRYIEKDSSDIPEIKNHTIAAGQIHANNFCGANLAISGERDAETKKAGIMVLQTAMNLDYDAGLEVDGIAGPKTYAALDGHYVKRGETQHMVTALEILFMLRGIECGGVESPGVFGEGLEDAVKDYKTEKGWKVNGTAGTGTFKSLMGV